MRATSFMIVAGVFVSCGAMRSSAMPAWHDELDGKWRVQFTGSVRVQLPIEFSTGGDAGATAVVLSNVGIHFRDAQWRSGQLRMKATTPQGPMKIDARVENGRLVGEWAADHAVGQFMVRGRLEGVRIPEDALAPIRGVAAFDSVWDVIRNRHYDPAFGGADWQAVRDELRPRAAAAESDGAAYMVIAAMLERVRTSHVSFAPVLPAAPAVAPGESDRVVEWRALSARTGYVRIAHFMSTGAELERVALQLDSAFSAVGHLPQLLIDLRNNPGGNAGVAALLAEHLSPDPVRVGVFASRLGLSSRRVQSIDELDTGELPVLSLRAEEGYRLQEDMAALGGAVMVVAGGSRGDAYRGVVAVLVNGNTHSTAEAVAGALGESGRATVLGTPSAGQMLAGRFVQVARGWQLMYPEYDYRTALGTKLDGTGVVPDVQLTGSGAELLERAQVWFEQTRE